MPASAGAQPVAMPDEAYWRLKSLLIERTGHYYYSDKDGLLWDKLRQRLRQTGQPNCAAYLDLLLTPGAGDREWQALEALITIGETFFFRYVEQFAALESVILPGLIARNQESKRLRIWSAGCAIGAEPYSVAILLNRLLGEAIQDWRVSITASDINDNFLQTAREGRYGHWPLRSLTRQQIERDFHPVPDGRSWILRPQHRALVRFERLNLLSLLDGRAPLQLVDFDLILCRNVLIYFHPETVVQLVQALAERLVPDGWLLLGHAEPNVAFETMLAPVNLPGTVAYQPRRAAAPAAPPSILPETSTSPMAPVVPRRRRPEAGNARRARPRTIAVAPASPVEPIRADAVTLDKVRALANDGDTEAAIATCRAALQADPTNAALQYYDGLLALAQNEPDHAEAAFRRAIYLYNQFAMAHYQLGQLLLANGQRQVGRRFLANAAQICAALPGDTLLPEGDDMSAAALAGLARAQLADNAVQD